MPNLVISQRKRATIVVVEVVTRKNPKKMIAMKMQSPLEHAHLSPIILLGVQRKGQTNPRQMP